MRDVSFKLSNLPKGVAPNIDKEALTNNKRKVFLFGSPSYTNIGDQAIGYAEANFIKNCFPYYDFVEIMDYATEEGIKVVKEVIRDNDIVCYTGGGNLGSLYPDIEEERRQVITAFKDYKTIVFPQSAFFEDNEHGESEKLKSQEAYHQNPQLVLCARDSESLKVLQKAFDCRILYTPDMVLSLKIEPRDLNREGVLFILRKDKEKVTDEDFISKLMHEAGKSIPVERTDTVLTDVDKIDYEDREHQLLKMLHRIGTKKLVITDRLHAMIFSIITETPCLVFGNSYGKAKHAYKDWLEELNFIEYTDKQDFDELRRMIRELLEGKPNDVDLEEDFQVLKNFFKE